MKRQLRIEESKERIKALRMELEELRKERALCRCVSEDFKKERNFGLLKKARERTTQADDSIRAAKKKLSREMALLTALTDGVAGAVHKQMHQDICRDMTNLIGAARLLQMAALSGGVFVTDKQKSLMSGDKVVWNKKTYLLYRAKETGKWMMKPEGKGYDDAIEAQQSIDFLERPGKPLHENFLDEVGLIITAYKHLGD